MKFYLHELQEALKSDESFIDLLRRDARSAKGKRKKRMAVVDQSSHPSVDTLHDYVLGSLPNEQTREVMDHLAVCEECARRSLEIRRLDKKWRRICGIGCEVLCPTPKTLLLM